MAKLTKKEVLHIAKLAQLKLTAAEVVKFQKQLSGIIGHISELGKINTDNTLPTSQTTGSENVFRTDVIKPDENLSLNDYFKTDAVITKK